MFNWKRLSVVTALIFLMIIIDVVLRNFGLVIGRSIFNLASTILILALLSSPFYDFYMFKRKQKLLYPELKQRALEVAKRKKGIIGVGELGKMPSGWHKWFIRKLKAEDIAEKDPRGGDKLLFPEIIAESHTEDEIMDMNFPMEIGSKIIGFIGEKEKKSEELGD